jgi:O-antigen/teichoic acid export membrane protein
VPAGLGSEIRSSLPLIALALPLVTAISALSGALQGREAFGPLNLSQMTGNVLYQLVPLGVAVAISPSLPGLVVAALAGRLVTAVMLAAFCRTRVPARGMPVFSISEIPSLLSFGGWVTVTGVISPLLTVLDRFVIGAIGGMAAVTAYTIPFNLVMRLAALPGSFQNALFPRFAASDAGAVTPMLVVGMLATKPFLACWIGQNLAAAAAPVGQILIVGLWANAMAFIPFGFLQSRSRPDLPAKFHAAELLVYLPLLFVLTSRDGVAGAAAAWDLRALADAALLFAAVRLMPALLSTWFGFLLILSAYVWAAAGVTFWALYWGVGAGLAGVSTLWAAAILPDDLRRRLRLLVGWGLPAPVPS